VEEIEILTAVPGVSPIATLLSLVELMGDLTVEIYPSCPSAWISRELPNKNHTVENAMGGAEDVLI